MAFFFPLAASKPTQLMCGCSCILHHLCRLPQAQEEAPTIISGEIAGMRPVSCCSQECAKYQHTCAMGQLFCSRLRYRCTRSDGTLRL